MSQPTPDQNEAFALIIDTSSSAAEDIDEARQTAQRIYRLAGAEQFKLFMLDSAKPISSTSLKQTSPPGVHRQTQMCSLIAPIMKMLVREEQKHSVIIVGNGEIFDLDDWIGDPRVDGWLLVRTGERSLQKADGRVSEIIADQISGDIDTLLSYFSRFTREAAEAPRLKREPDAYKWRIDASGYPLIFVEPLEAYIQLFPVTKPQFERFIASDAQRDLDDEWYEELLTLNPRASYTSSDIPERERLFMTGITPEEAAAFAHWLGRDYQMLTAQEWHTCYKWLADQASPSAPPDLSEPLSQDALAIWNTISGQWLEWHRQSNLQELSLMTQGILEWVVERPGRYCGLGEPLASKFQRKANDPVRPMGKRRLKNLGFRLLMR